MSQKMFAVLWWILSVAILLLCAIGVLGRAANSTEIPLPSPRIIVPERPESVPEPQRAVPAWSEEQFVFPVRPGAQPVDAEDLELLACVIYQEAGSDAISDWTRLAVGNVVLNRVADERFPDTVAAVLLQEGQYGEYSWTGVRWLPSAEYEPWAVARAYDCARRLLEGERVLPEDVVWQAGFTQGYEVYASSDGVYFCR